MIAALSAADIANMVRMMRTRFEGAIGLVEGILDVRVYDRMMQGECRLIPGYGKETTLAALNILEERDERGIFAIVDSDFEKILGGGAVRPNVIRSDGHDLETQIIGSPALEKIVAEYGSVAKARGRDVRAVLLGIGEVIGSLRLVSLRDDLNLTFEGLTFSRFIERDEMSIDVAALVTAVKNKSGRPDLGTADLVGRVGAVVGQYDALDICCGPDLVAVLGLGFRKALGSCNASDVSQEALGRSLRLAYERGHFALTATYRSLLDWQTGNPGYRVLAEVV